MSRDPTILLDDDTGRLLFWPQALPEDQVTAIDHDIVWKQDTISMYGRQIHLPRLTAWYGDAVYFYSGIRNDPLPWTPGLLEIKNIAEALTGHPFNSVLANRYEAGRQYMNWHADNESSLGPRPSIASVSFGATRRFVLKHRHDGRKIEVPLTDGSLLMMAGNLQSQWLHALPKTTKPVGLRINFTFRLVRTSLQRTAAD